MKTTTLRRIYLLNIKIYLKHSSVWGKVNYWYSEIYFTLKKYFQFMNYAYCKKSISEVFLWYVYLVHWLINLAVFVGCLKRVCAIWESPAPTNLIFFRVTGKLPIIFQLAKSFTCVLQLSDVLLSKLERKHFLPYSLVLSRLIADCSSEYSKRNLEIFNSPCLSKFQHISK